MAKPKGPSNPKTGKKFPAESSLEITEKRPIQTAKEKLETYFSQQETIQAKEAEAKNELILSNLYSEKQKTQLEDRIASMGKSLARDRELKDKKREEEKEKKPKTITLGPKVGIKKYISELNKGECTVDFYKRTSRPRGEFRRMRCTLQGKDVTPQNPIKPGIITVWDLDKGDWRSFYHNSILKLVRNEETDAE